MITLAVKGTKAISFQTYKHHHPSINLLFIPNKQRSVVQHYYCIENLQLDKVTQNNHPVIANLSYAWNKSLMPNKQPFKQDATHPRSVWVAHLSRKNLDYWQLVKRRRCFVFHETLFLLCIQQKSLKCVQRTEIKCGMSSSPIKTILGKSFAFNSIATQSLLLLTVLIQLCLSKTLSQDCP